MTNMTTTTSTLSTIEAAGIRLSFDSGGRLMSLINVATGHDYIRAQGQGIWKLLLANADGTRWIVPVLAAEQSACVSEVDGGLDIRYAELRLAGAPVPLEVVVRIRPQGAAETVWDIEIANRSDYCVEEVWFPIIAGVESLAGDPAADALIWPQTSGMRIPNPRAAFNAGGWGSRSYFSASPDWLGYSVEARRLRAVYPGRACMQWFGLYNDHEGLYLASHDTSRQTSALNLVNHDDGLALSFIKYPFVRPETSPRQPGASWRSAPFVVAVDNADIPEAGCSWHAGARRYRRWADTWLKLPDVPAWVRAMDGWLLTFLKWPFGRINWTFGDIALLWQHTKAAGLNVMKINAWFSRGMDRGYPFFDADPAMSRDPDPASQIVKRDPGGGEAGLRAAIEAVRRDGGHVFLYFNGMIMDPDDARVRPFAQEWSAKTRFGHPYVESYSFYREGSIDDPLISGRMICYPACQSLPAWREKLIGMVEQGLDLGADGLTFDQMGGLSAFLCFDPSHPHASPSDALGAPRYDNMMAMRRRMKEINPDAALETEFHCDAFIEACDIFVAPDISPAYGTLGFPELFIYTFPEVVLIKSHLDTNGLSQLHVAFTYGMKFGTHPGQGAGTLADYPRLTERIAYLVSLRDEYPELLRNGRFIDTDWGRIDNPRLLAKGFAGGERVAVVIYNYTLETQPYALDVPDFEIERVIPGDAGRADPGSGSVPPNDLNVIILRRQVHA